MAIRRLEDAAFALATFFIWIILADGAIFDLYNTKIATSDLRWTKEPRNSWEEVSGFDHQNNIIRSYQICQLSSGEKNNWLRSPFIHMRGAQRVNVEIEFSIANCDWPGMDTEYCRQTFNLFYYESDKDVASSTFPPWQERPYLKIDTVAANSNDQINKKTFTIGPLKSNGGIYIAAQDEGACMSLISLRVYYYYCPETIRSLATFAQSMTGTKTASLVTVPGNCVPNAEKINGIVPKYYCGSTGEWQIITGRCKCTAGYHPNVDSTACMACPTGTFKIEAGNGKCLKCPANSGPVHETDARETAAGATALVKISSQGLTACPCHPGFARAKYESLSKPCTKIPSAPIFGDTEVNATAAQISWKKPLDLGGRSDLYYSISCQACHSEEAESCQDCPEQVSYPLRYGNNPEDTVSLQSLTKFPKTQIDVVNLEPFTRYVFKIYAHNAVSETLGKEAPYLRVQLTTNESVPSPVVNIYVADTSLTSVIITWQAPSNPRGRLLGYEVEVSLRRSASKYTSASDSATSDDDENKPIVIETKKSTCSLTDLESDSEYLVRIRAKTAVGFGRYSASVMFKTSKRNKVEAEKSDEENGAGFLIAAISVVLALAVVCSLLVFYYSRRKGRSSVTKKSKSFSKPNSALLTRYKEDSDRAKPLVQRRRENTQDSQKTAYVEYPDPRRAVQRMNKEISPLNLRLHNTIGEGEFAVVYKATMMEGNEMKTVAAKQLKEGASSKDQSNFLKEVCTMAQFNHPNIMQLKGVITKHKPEMLISEYMENGSLHQFLKHHRRQLTMPQLLHMLRGIANGMRYLSDMRFVHRDLAARNILVDSDFTCKVADFGLSRILEYAPRATYTTQGGKIALRWTAPECIRFREFTSASDVWSYGIVMWEVLSYGEKPYWEMTNNDVMHSIGKGLRLPAPTGCPKALHQLMLECWSLHPVKRPTFAKIVSDLNKFIRHSSLLQARHEEEMERSVCCTPDAKEYIEIVNVGESFLDDHSSSNQELDYTGSDSSSLSQEDTCSSVVPTDERCLNV